MRIDVDVQLSTLVMLSDTGYTNNMTLPEVEKWAKDRIRAFQLLLKEGGTEPKVVQAAFEIRKILYTP